MKCFQKSLRPLFKKKKKKPIHTFILSSLSEHFTCFLLFFNIFAEQLPCAFSFADFSFLSSSLVYSFSSKKWSSWNKLQSLKQKRKLIFFKNYKYRNMFYRVKMPFFLKNKNTLFYIVYHLVTLISVMHISIYIYVRYLVNFL